MRPKLINRSHTFLIGRIIGVVGDFRDFAQSVSRRLDAFSAIFFRLVAESSIGSQTWRWNGRRSEFISLLFNHLAILRFELGSTRPAFILPIDSDCAKPRGAAGGVGIQPTIWEAIWEASTCIANIAHHDVDPTALEIHARKKHSIARYRRINASSWNEQPTLAILARAI
jgi:hypothetical protein